MSAFDDAFNFTMKWEVGPWFDPTDPEVIAGLCDSPMQQRKTGYVNHKADRGGETKMGIAKNSHPNIDIKKMTLAAAKEVYRITYWQKAQCDELTGKMGVAMFDAAVNHGVRRAVILLQRAVGAVDDGDFGPATLAAVMKAAPSLTPAQLLAPRKKFFADIVKNDPSQAAFVKGWLNRVNDLEKYVGDL